MSPWLRSTSSGLYIAIEALGAFSPRTLALVMELGEKSVRRLKTGRGTTLFSVSLLQSRGEM